MKLGEIKLEALRMMRAGKPSEMYLDNLEFLKDSEGFSEYLLGMPGAINRAFTDIEAKNVLAEKRAVLLEGEECEAKYGLRMRLELPDLISDYLELVRLVCESEDEYNGNYPYLREGECIVVTVPRGCTELSAIYKPKISRVFSYTPEETEIELPDEICALIPYFIKSELYTEDEPDEAASARALYEAEMLSLMKPEANGQNKVDSRYNFCEVTYDG